MHEEQASTDQNSLDAAPDSSPSSAPVAQETSTETTDSSAGEREATPLVQPVTPLPKVDSKGDIDSKVNAPADPDTVRHARAYAKTTGKWPRGYTPSEEDQRVTGAKPRTDAEQPGVHQSAQVGGALNGAAPAAPGSAEAARASLTAQYAAIPDDEHSDNLYKADAELMRNGWDAGDLLALKPERRLHLASAALKRVDGFRRALGSQPQQAPSDPARRTQFPAGQQAPSGQARNAPTNIPPDQAERIRDVFTFLPEGDRESANAMLDQLLANPARSQGQQTQHDQHAQGDPAASDQFTTEEAELAEGNLEHACAAIVKDNPWVKDSPEALKRVVQRAQRLAESPRVILSARKLTALMQDAAALVFAKEIRTSKNAAGQAARTAGAGATLSGPAPTGATSVARRLTDDERSSTAKRAAIESRGDPARNAALLKQFRDEIAARPL